MHKNTMLYNFCEIPVFITQSISIFYLYAKTNQIKNLKEYSVD